MIEKLFITFIEISLTYSIIISTLFLFSSKLFKNYTAKWRYFIWIILALRLIIPLNLNLLKSPILITTPDFIESKYSNIPIVKESSIKNTLEEKNISNKEVTFDEFNNSLTSENENSHDNTIESNLSNEIALSFLKPLSIIWFLGIILSITYETIGYFIFRKTTLRWSIPVTDKQILNIFYIQCESINIKKSVKLLSCKKISSPMLIGLFNPIILLPCKDISILNLPIILKHELIHLKHHDISYKLLMTITKAIHWFNPLVYLMVAHANRDLEFYCDDKVVENMDICSKLKYSESILAIMKYTPKYVNTFSTNFNGGVDNMKKRFKNIFDTKKKLNGISLLCIIFFFSIVMSSLIACERINPSPDKDVAETFIENYYTISNYTLADQLSKLIESSLEGRTPSNGETGIVTISPENETIIREACLKNIGDSITSQLGDELILNRFPLSSIKMAMDYEYTTTVSNIILDKDSSDNDTEAYYNYNADINIIYNDGYKEKQTLEGKIKLVNENKNWLVSIFTPFTELLPNKKYYNPQNLESNLIKSYDSPHLNYNISSAEEFCNLYMNAMKNKEYSFIYNNTVNSSKNTTLEEGQKIWNEIDIDYIKIRNSEVRSNKAYYELEINVEDPGHSAFDKGVTLRWLYIFYSEKSNTWVAEGLMSDGEPDETWWNTIYGG